MLEITTLQIKIEHLFNLPSRSSQSKVTTKRNFYKLPLYFFFVIIQWWYNLTNNKSPHGSFSISTSIFLGLLLSNQIKDSDLSPYSFFYPICQDIVYFMEANKSFLPPPHEQEQIQFLWTWTLFIWGRAGFIKKTE